MNEIPSWWLAVTGIAGILIAIFFMVLIFMVAALIKLVQELQKPVTDLVHQVNDLVPTVKSLVVKVEDLTEKVEGIADSTKHTVDIVGVKAQSIASTMEHVSNLASAQLNKLAPILGLALAGFRMFGIIKEARRAGAPKVRVEKTPSGVAVELAPGETVRVKKVK